MESRTVLRAGEVPVTGPGVYDRAGATYVLVDDISGPTTPIFLGKDVTLDLNGHTVTYADAEYQHIPNYGFEQGLEGWDLSAAPDARVLKTAESVPFIGEKLCSLPAGQQLVSPYITLPVADRSYYAMVGVTDRRMKVSIYVEDGAGEAVICSTRIGDQAYRSCPQESSSPKLGGGIPFAHLHHQPAGQYRVRVLADTDAYIDQIDIRPALDAGIAAIGETLPWAHYDAVVGDNPESAFFDYTEEGSASTPIGCLPRIEGTGRITIKNGAVRGGTRTIRSWGIHARADSLFFEISNVEFVASGINAHGARIPNGVVEDCRFEIDTPFIIQRHQIRHKPLDIYNADSRTEVSGCQFVGGQGCLAVRGDGASIHDNVFAPEQTVTNHYALTPGGSGHRIFRNRFVPKRGSGILLYRTSSNEIFDNEFEISADAPICEYHNEDYSVNAIRITDYNARPTEARVCDGNRFYRNRIRVIGRAFPEYTRHPSMAKYEPRTYAFFISVGGGTNYIYDNEIDVDDQAPSARSDAYAFFIGASDNGGKIFRNTIRTNVPAFWIGNSYGPGGGAEIYENTIIKTDGAPPDFKPIRFGWGDVLATGVIFRDNEFINTRFAIDATNGDHTYERQ